ncbi:MAG: tetratricopeptide repeat protein [Armatimonadetes bacterium]|nr:tetratricopeptide repeat protein [Armatimonadota bacterium]
MRCSKCGTANDSANKFCKECGQKLSDPGVAKELTPDEHLKVGEFVYLAYRESDAGHVENAIAACQGALAINEDNPAIHALLGSLYARMGDLARAIYEYERVVALNPGSLEDRRKLEQLRVQLLMPAPIVKPPRPAIRLADLKWFKQHRDKLPWVAAALAFLIVVAIGSAAIRGSRTRDASPRDTQAQNGAPDNRIPGQPLPYGPGAYTPPAGQAAEPPTAGRGQTDRQAVTAPAVPTTRPGIPSVPLPGTNTRPNSPVRQPSAPTQERPAITPIIRPSGGGTGTSTSTTNAARPRTPVIRPAPDSVAAQPSVSPEERGRQLHREGKYDEAISSYREALNQTSDAGRVYQQIAMSYQRKGDHTLAIDSYNRAIRSFRDQLNTGRDKAEVERNIRACEAGIEVSRSASR